MAQSFNLALAPAQLTQTINPWSWTFGDMSLFTVNLGQSSDPGFEARVLEQVGTYGRQIGRHAPTLEGSPEQLELFLEGTDADAEDHPSPRQDIEGGVALHDLERVVVAQHQHVGGQLDLGGARRDPRCRAVAAVQ